MKAARLILCPFRVQPRPVELLPPAAATSGVMMLSVNALMRVLNSEGNNQADSDDDQVTLHQEVLESLEHRWLLLFVTGQPCTADPAPKVLPAPTLGPGHPCGSRTSHAFLALALLPAYEQIPPVIGLDVDVELPSRRLDSPPGGVPFGVGHALDLIEASDRVTNVRGVVERFLPFVRECEFDQPAAASRRRR